MLYCVLRLPILSMDIVREFAFPSLTGVHKRACEQGYGTVKTRAETVLLVLRSSSGSSRQQVAAMDAHIAATGYRRTRAFCVPLAGCVALYFGPLARLVLRLF